MRSGGPCLGEVAWGLCGHAARRGCGPSMQLSGKGALQPQAEVSCGLVRVLAVLVACLELLSKQSHLCLQEKDATIGSKVAMGARQSPSSVRR